MSYAITPADQPSLPIDGSEERFAVRRIYCVGRNYRAHNGPRGRRYQLDLYPSRFSYAKVPDVARDRPRGLPVLTRKSS